MLIPEDEKKQIKICSKFLLEKGYKLSEKEFLEYEKDNVKICIGYTYQESFVNIFFLEPFSCFRLDWMLVYMKNKNCESYISRKYSKIEKVKKELYYLQIFFEKLTDYDYCKKTQDENMAPLPEVNLDSLNL